MTAPSVTRRRPGESGRAGPDRSPVSGGTAIESSTVRPAPRQIPASVNLLRNLNRNRNPTLATGSGSKSKITIKSKNGLARLDSAAMALGGLLLTIRNRQRTRRVDLRLLRQITKWVLTEQLRVGRAELCLHLVRADEIAEVNWNFLRHQGPTDVITFDHADLFVVPPSGGPARCQQGGGPSFHGELYLSLDAAVAQARRFRTTWPGELVRYVIHGLLHLAGYDDLQPAARRRLKCEENRLMSAAARLFPLSRLGRQAGRSSATSVPPGL